MLRLLCLLLRRLVHAVLTCVFCSFCLQTIHRTLRTYTKANKLLPIMYTKVYMYQIARSLSYIHSLGVCHRDIKPQNLLLNTKTHHVLLCDFGSAKVLVPGEPNVSYICSRYYRAPELVFEATSYQHSIDVWSLGQQSDTALRRASTQLGASVLLLRANCLLAGHACSVALRHPLLQAV